MWLFLSILAIIMLVVTVILSIPVKIIIKNDQDNNLTILYKILFKTFGENPDPDNSVVKLLKEVSGVSAIEKKSMEKNVGQSGWLDTTLDTLNILTNLLKEIASLLKYCTAKRFEINILCSEENAADTAINYGRYCAVVYPMASFLNSIMKVRKKGQKLNIQADFSGGESEFSYDFLISVTLFRVLVALFKVALKEAKRKNEEELKAAQNQSR